MKQLFVIIKNELLRYFVSPLAYIYLVSFLCLNAVAAFYFGHWFERGEASLFYMFVYQPWLYLLFLPGISMRLFAEEFRLKTIVQIMTMPISLPVLVWGKFLAAWIFAGFALFLTFPFVITVNVLGSPDNAVIMLSYFASFCLAGAMLAISQTMSALTKNQVIALVLAVIANLIFFFSGMEFVLSVFRLMFPDYIVDTIASFSFLTHIGNMIGGTLAWTDILFFASIIIVFNFVTMLIISFKTSGTSFWLKSTHRGNYILAVLFIFLGFIGFNLLAKNLTSDTELDLTEEQFYTLNQNTIDILQSLKEPVTAKLYFSDVLAKRNPNFRQMFDRVKTLLAHYKTASNGKFDYRIYHPVNLDNIEDRAISDGLKPIPLIDLNQNALFGLSVVDTLDHKAVIDYLSPARISNLEQDLTALIYGLNHTKKTVGVLSSLPINGISMEGVVIPQYQIISKISQFYQIKTIEKPEDFTDIDVLMLVHPKNLSQEMINAIQAFSKDKGKIFLFLDTATEAVRLYLPSNAPLSASDPAGLDTFWGFKFYGQYVVADLENSLTVDATTNYRTNPAYTQDVIEFKLKEKNLNPFHPVSKNLHTVLMSSAAVIMPNDAADVSFIPLMQAGQNSALMSSEVVYKGLNPREILSYFEKDDNAKFLSAYIHGKSSEHPFDLLVVTDTDFLYDTFWGEQQNLADEKYFVGLFNNADFVLNGLDFLLHDDSLLALRGKGAKNRAFDGIERERKESMFAYKVKEEQIFKSIEQAKKDLQEVWGKRDFEERTNFTADELAIISNIKQTLNQHRRELSELKLRSLSKIENTALLIKLLNIFGIPLLLSFACLIVVLKRSQTLSKPFSFKINRELMITLLAALVLLGLGSVSVILSNTSDIASFEDKPLLKNFDQKINDVAQIKLQDREHTLTFERRAGIWHLKEHPFPVYQERIKSFLSALMESTIYEKKSDKAENLAQFGLSPLEVEGSQKHIVTLSNEDGHIIQTLEIGKYDIELSRGASGAYVKFPDKFQVWLAQAEFVDLSLDFHAWTYSHPWDLRFGRLTKVNQITDEQTLADMVKNLLNIGFIGAAKKLNHLALLKAYVLETEDDITVWLTVFKSGDKYYVQYKIPDNVSDKHLSFFKAMAKQKYFEISSDDWKKLNDVEQTKK